MKNGLITLAVFICLVFSLSGGVSAATITDVKGHWAEASINKWISAGYVSGYPEGLFKPNQKISRAEFVTLVNKAFKKQNPNSQCKFSDVKQTDWFYPGVLAGVAGGYISGYEGGTFKPGKFISRQEAAVIITRLLQLNNGSNMNFKDANSIPGWSASGIKAVVANNIMKGYSDGTFKAAQSITRAEAVTALDRAYVSFMAFQGVKGSVKMNNCPVEGALVKLFARNNPSVLKDVSTTDSNGMYKIAAQPGSYNLEVNKDGSLGYAYNISIGKGIATLQDFSLVKVSIN
ncbi:S-layer domain protein [Desulfofarcimen acetoxidans DSM 771]|jgi:hypothetical protein|uniref:S-layer domain protein n=1 Tax=Desulfofarcimen acetoxidans (strain ATCC 49208 / DSM 771 / KCTC 5769 / VKM B-1644 / 5575) TaxID=485916 RepID=C8VYG9_DESAS|nr:S-layer homology domain-containing protein [Desulfofarcimen acetoxidans]ACV62850.1 S-layer domain protein [Desulfofarcimen acetoxidans DSM 771]